MTLKKFISFIHGAIDLCGTDPEIGKTSAVWSVAREAYNVTKKKWETPNLPENVVSVFLDDGSQWEITVKKIA